MPECMRQEKKMSEQQQHRELRKPGALNSMLLIVGIIVGSIVPIVLLVVLQLGIFGIGIAEGIGVGGVLILVWAIPGILIGLMVFRGYKKKASSRTVLIVVPAFSGIVGGLVVGGALAFCVASWVFQTHCC